MSGQVAQTKTHVFHAYIIITPTLQFKIRNNLQKIKEKIVERAVLRSSRVTFAYAELVNSTQAEFMCDHELLQKADAHLSLLMDEAFSSVWFYGDKTSEYTRWVARTALNCEIRIMNKAEEGSLLDRYLQNWMKAPRTPP
jgi:hypothetical protein